MSSRTMSDSLALAWMAAESLGRLFCRRLRMILRVAATAMIALALLAPFLRSNGLASVAGAVYSAEKLVCHQESNRCIELGGEPTALCSRCLGGYVGFLAASFLFNLRFNPGRRVRSVIAILGVAALLDIVSHFVGLYDTANLYRLVSGSVAGMGLGMLVFRFVSGVEASEYC